MMFVMAMANYFPVVYCIKKQHHSNNSLNKWRSCRTFRLNILVRPSPISPGKQRGECFWRFVSALHPLGDLAESHFWKRRVGSAIETGRIVGSVHFGIVLGGIITDVTDLERSCSRMVLNFLHRGLDCG